MKSIKEVLIFTLGASTVVAIVMLTAYTGPKDEATTSTAQAMHLMAQNDSFAPPQMVRPPQLPDKVDFAAEALPIENFDAKERFDRELIANCFRHSSTFVFLKRANRYFPIIEPILKKHGLPDDFKYLAVAESNLSNAVSPAGARGFWQFMRSSAKERGLEVNNEVDERYHLEKATVAACQYLKEAYKNFDSWTLAAASYNMGKAGLKKRMEQQGGKNYFDLFLNAETSRYILRIMAIKEVMQHPKKYGFYVEKEELYPPLPNCKEVTVKEGITNLGDFAKKHKVSYRMLKVYNPWLRNTYLTNKSKKTYKIKIPVE